MTGARGAGSGMGDADEPRGHLTTGELEVVLLDARGVRALFAELALETDVQGLRGKLGGDDAGAPSAATLGAARDALIGGRSGGVQVRYRHEEQDWSTTIAPAGDGFRAVRVRVTKVTPPR